MVRRSRILLPFSFMLTKQIDYIKITNDDTNYDLEKMKSKANYGW